MGLLLSVLERKIEGKQRRGCAPQNDIMQAYSQFKRSQDAKLCGVGRTGRETARWNSLLMPLDPIPCQNISFEPYSTRTYSQ